VSEATSLDFREVLELLLTWMGDAVEVQFLRGNELDPRVLGGRLVMAEKEPPVAFYGYGPRAIGFRVGGQEDAFILDPDQFIEAFAWDESAYAMPGFRGEGVEVQQGDETVTVMR
jgi:hypothetical protein